jgi:predicted RND superfamily exporter protein
MATSTVLFFSALTLWFSPFKHVAGIGLLLAAAALVALIGDLVFMPSTILLIRPFRRLLAGRMAVGSG